MTAPKITTSSAGLVVEADTLADALRAVAEHRLSGADTGPLLIHGHRTAQGQAHLLVRLSHPRIEEQDDNNE